MKKYAGFRNGYVRVRIYGEQTERFLNLCRAREIRISDLRSCLLYTSPSPRDS